MLASSCLGVAPASPASDVLSILISAGVFKPPRTLSLMSVPFVETDDDTRETLEHLQQRGKLEKFNDIC